MKIWELFSKPGTWTTGVSARNNNGDFVTWASKEATCFCTVGAIYKYYGDQTRQVIKRLRDHLIIRDTDDLFKWNDSNTQEGVVSILKELDI